MKQTIEMNRMIAVCVWYSIAFDWNAIWISISAGKMVWNNVRGKNNGSECVCVRIRESDKNDKMEILYACAQEKDGEKGKDTKGAEERERSGEDYRWKPHIFHMAWVEKCTHESIRCEKMPGDATRIEITFLTFSIFFGRMNIFTFNCSCVFQLSFFHRYS